MRERPMLYLQYAHEWFVDSVNFDGRQTRELDGLPKAARKLVRRLDARSWVAMHQQYVFVCAPVNDGTPFVQCNWTEDACDLG